MLQRPLIPEWRGWPAVGLIVLFIAGIVGLLFFAPEYSIQPADQQTNSRADGESGGNIFSPFLIISAYFGSWDSEDLIALFTAILTGSTVLLWLSTRESARIAERALTNLERPWILITDADASGIIAEQPFVRLELANYGRTVGGILGICGAVKASRDPIDLETLQLNKTEFTEVREAVPPNQPHTVTIRLKPFLGADAPALIQEGSATYVIRGIIKYRGLLDVAYETGYCLKYDAEREAFARHGGEKYNYTR